MPITSSEDGWFYRAHWDRVLAGLENRDKVRVILRRGYVVCGSMFLSLHIPTYAQRISELRQWEGLNIAGGQVRMPDGSRVKCPYSTHRHNSRLASYRLIPDPEEVDDG